MYSRLDNVSLGEWEPQPVSMTLMPCLLATRNQTKHVYAAQNSATSVVYMNLIYYIVLFVL